MGVKGYLSLIKQLYKKPIIKTSIEPCDLFVIDGNCVLHDVLSNYEHILSPDTQDISTRVAEKFKSMIVQTHFTQKKHVCICFDGVPPSPKQICQYKRRKGDLSLSCLLLPKTNLMKEIEKEVITLLKCDWIDVHGSTLVGEGEQKIFQYLKTQNLENKIVLLMSYDSDVIILSQLYLNSLTTCKPTIIVNLPSIYGFIVNVNLLNEAFKKLDMLNGRLILLCAICGNDFFPKIIRSRKSNILTNI